MDSPPSDSQVPMLIGDARVRTAAQIDVRNPWDGGTVAQVALGDASHLDQAAAAAASALRVTRQQSSDDRAGLLARVAAGLKQRRDAFAATIMQEAGKPIALAEAEVDRAIITFTDAAAQARRWNDEPLDAAAYAPGVGHAATLRRVPAGVVYGMTPFNFPLNLVAHKVAPAIACGASIIIKPSPRTPLSAFKLAGLILDVGGTPGQVSVVTCPNELAAKLIDDARIGVVSFTGSVPVGWKIKQQAIKKRVTLELGGNAAAVVHDDAELDAAVVPLATGAFAYAGQSCISVQRIFVQRSSYDRFRDRLIEHVQTKIRTGDPRDRSVINGPLIDGAARDRVLQMINSAVKAGGKVLTGGRADGPCVEPTILEDVPADHPLASEEAFAPVAVLIRYDEFDEALRKVNDSRFGLQAGVFTRDPALAQQAFDTLDVGAVLINQTPTFRLDHLPYGGVKDSGVGREGVRWAMEEMSEMRVRIEKSSD